MGLTGFPDSGHRFCIRQYRHVLFDPALRRGLRAAQTTPAFAKVILREVGW